MADCIFKGFMFGFWLMMFSCIVGYLARKMLFTITGFLKQYIALLRYKYIFGGKCYESNDRSR